MEFITVYAIALLPAMLLMGYILWKDRNQPEPIELIVRGFFYGALASLPASIMESILTIVLGWTFKMPVVGSLIQSFVVAGCCEEVVKLWFFWLLIRKNPYFDERFDGIVYCVSVGLGFAALENIMYVVQGYPDWQTVAFTRFFLSVPGHYAFAVIMGALFGLYYFEPTRYRRLKPWILIGPIIAHGIYDSLCFLEEEFTKNNPLYSAVILVCLLVFCVIMHKWVKKRLDKQLRKDGIVKGRHTMGAVGKEGMQLGVEYYSERELEKIRKPSGKLFWGAVIYTVLSLIGSYCVLLTNKEKANFTGWGIQSGEWGVYEGDIVKGSGKGVCHEAFGDNLENWYEGEWNDSVGSQGLGMEYIEGNRTYYGHWTEGNPEGMGIMLRHDSLMVGQFSKEQCTFLEALYRVKSNMSSVVVIKPLAKADGYLSMLDSIAVLQDTIKARSRAARLDNTWKNTDMAPTVKKIKGIITS